MKMVKSIPWYPLFPGEIPGDPDLGGWRPLHSRFFSGKVRSARIKTPDLLTGIKQLAQEITMRNLRSAIQFVAITVSLRNQVLVRST